MIVETEISRKGRQQQDVRAQEFAVKSLMPQKLPFNLVSSSNENRGWVRVPLLELRTRRGRERRPLCACDRALPSVQTQEIECVAGLVKRIPKLKRAFG